MALICGIDCTFTLYILTFEKQKQGKHNKARIVVDENHHVKAINPPEGWTTAPERLRKSIWSDELDSYMSETFGLNHIRAVMASTEESKLYTVVIQCGNKIFHWDEYLGDLHEVIEPKSLEEIVEAM